jgi:Fe-S-cluster containining protein
MSPPRRGEEERSALCLACGLCCQGALHDLVPLDEDELPRAEKLRLHVVESPHRLAFRLPCPRLDDRRCTVYAERPRTCASYACETLRAYGVGEIEEAEALARIRAVGELSARIPALEGTARAEAARERARLRRTWFDP